jgi:adenine-specific DNA-methyltransferase
MWFGKDGKGIPRRKTYLNERKGVVPWTWWTNKEVGHNQEAKKEIIALFGAKNTFDTPKPERLIQRVLQIATNSGDLVLDSFLGSGTTAAVAQKMGRRYIGIELGDHCYTHCLPRLKAVVDGEQGGISKAEGWTGGGGFKFYELSPTLIIKDSYGNPVFSDKYNAEMLVAAVAKLNGFVYACCL